MLICYKASELVELEIAVVLNTTVAPPQKPSTARFLGFHMPQVAKSHLKRAMRGFKAMPRFCRLSATRPAK